MQHLKRLASGIFVLHGEVHRGPGQDAQAGGHVLLALLENNLNIQEAAQHGLARGRSVFEITASRSSHLRLFMAALAAPTPEKTTR
jgi:hypothetical protein